ncbi:MAG: GatB/YqeY domain-containing protein [Gammaproteobacteria bacterium]|nr:GatB/YqeY domain-containing protein [Gammaproteobacteria bacterium]
MSALKDRIQDDMKSAMRAGEKERLVTIRMLLSAIKQREVDERTETTDTAVLQILEKLVKQRRESATQFAAGNRPDLEAKELSEIKLLQAYLPTALSAAELDSLINEVIASTGAGSMKDMGKVMAALREKAQGRADFATIGERVKARLSGQ